MVPNYTRSRSQAVAVTAISAPIGLFVAYIAYLVIPEVLRVVVPAVVQTVAAR
jgi:hypothetical protein